MGTAGGGSGTGGNAGRYTGPADKRPAGKEGVAGDGPLGDLERPPIGDPAGAETPPRKPGFSASGKKLGRPVGPAKESKEEQQARLLVERDKAIASLTKATPKLLDMPFDAMARARGEHWRLDAETRGLLVDAVHGMLLAYMPLEVSRHVPLFMFLGIATSAVATRYYQDVALAVERKAKLERERSKPRGPTGVKSDAGEPAA